MDARMTGEDREMTAQGPTATEITPIRSSDANCYLVRAGSGFVLIDTGYPTERQALLDALQVAGCRAGDLRLVLLTHGDIDHAGSCAYLQRVYNAKVDMHAGDAPLVQDGTMPERECRSLLIKTVLSLASLFHRNVGMEGFERFAPDILVDEEFDLSPYGFDARIIHAPGHTEGSICVLTSDGALFSGDTPMNARKRFIVSGWAGDHEALGASVDRLMTLPICTVYPGHLKPFQMAQFLKKNR
jgi:glyoxylase-like metal-dependent hydrolase (beta-lactamase superfamily II)